MKMIFEKKAINQFSEFDKINESMDGWNTLVKIMNDPKFQNVEYSNGKTISEYAKMLLSQLNTAGGSEIMKDEIKTFLDGLNIDESAMSFTSEQQKDWSVAKSNAFDKYVDMHNKIEDLKDDLSKAKDPEDKKAIKLKIRLAKYALPACKEKFDKTE